MEFQFSLNSSEFIEEWEAFEENGVICPYQRYDWTSHWAHWHNCAESKSIFVLVSVSGKPIALIPLYITKTKTGTKCTWLGGSQVNYAMPVLAKNFLELCPEQVFEQLSTELIIETKANFPEIDLFEFRNQPLMFNGQKNPLAPMGTRPAISDSYLMDLQEDFDALYRERRSKRARKVLTKKRKKLEQELGTVSLLKCSTEQDVDLVLEAFFRQRAARFAEQGIKSKFSEPNLNGFVDNIAHSETANDAEARPFQFYALLAGDTVCATYGGVGAQKHFSCFINSMEPGDVSQCSPGEILLHDVIEDLCHSGYTSMDLGVGHARYKEAWCEIDPLVDTLLPVSVRGNVMAMMQSGRLAVESMIKSSDNLWHLYKISRAKIGQIKDHG
ncbi:MAG: GNAT family N-acetyltransferase [Rhizobiales bacterium]|nr:GNAT family N-acetyltransferase [Hyphomicrobiales bacterium]